MGGLGEEAIQYILVQAIELLGRRGVSWGSPRIMPHSQICHCTAWPSQAVIHSHGSTKSNAWHITTNMGEASHYDRRKIGWE